MNKITCEMCGSTDLIKDGGVFICQHCGCKYTIEEAKKLMVEGTVKVDTSEKLKNLYVLARRARESGDSRSAVMYYEQIALEDPNNWEPVFYKTYYSSMNCRIYQIASAANSLANCIPTVFKLVLKQYPKDTEMCRLTGANIGLDVQIAAYQLLNAAIKHYGNNSGASSAYSEFLERGTSCTDLLIVLGIALTEIGEYEVALRAYKNARKWAYGSLAGRIYVEPSRRKLVDTGILDTYQKQFSEQHPDLIQEKKTLENEIKELEKTPIVAEYNRLDKELNETIQEKSKLGLFKGKEKKQLQAKIDDIQMRLSKLKVERDAIMGEKTQRLTMIKSQMSKSIDSILASVE